tara:strand:+ start:928 stop:2703 length:1776 start_codon:yes stop_codon:yes gene_type:complete
MANYVGSVSWGIVPLNWDNSNLAGMSWDDRSNFLKSANDQLRYQVQWFHSGIHEGAEVGNEGNIVNVIFKIETSVDSTNWTTIGKIKKSRDIANRKYDDGTQPPGHRFTVDISQLVSDQLSYSLCPIGKGTWQSSYYGGMNGGLTMQDNVLGNNSSYGRPVSFYNVSENGTFRRLRVSATFEILDANKNIITASGSLSSAPYITVINSVNQFERDSLFYNSSYNMGNYASNKWNFLSRCPNFTDSGTPTYDFKKPIRIDEQAEYLQFYIRRASSYGINAAGTSGDVGAIGLKVETFLANGNPENTFYLRDFEDNLLTEVVSGSRIIIKDYQEQMFVQNISPYYINNTAALKSEQDPIDRYSFPYWNTYTGDKITSSTAYYRVSMSRFSMWSDYAERRTTVFNYYTIDRESENIPYGYVRFHWLNSVGGIDSYTAKRDIVEGLTIDRNVIERKSGDRTWYQANSGSIAGGEVNVSDSSYISDTMRGGDLYKGGREVLGVNADRVQSVYTEPLNKSVANWLEEMMLSPNVWIEKDTEATARGNSSNPYLRPSTKEYIPVIITNSDAETVNQSEGLVKFNIEYTLAHKVKTQRN